LTEKLSVNSFLTLTILDLVFVSHDHTLRLTLAEILPMASLSSKCYSAVMIIIKNIFQMDVRNSKSF